MRSAVHDRSFPGNGSVRGIIDLFKKFSLDVATKHLVWGGEGGLQMLQVCPIFSIRNGR